MTGQDILHILLVLFALLALGWGALVYGMVWNINIEIQKLTKEIEGRDRQT